MSFQDRVFEAKKDKKDKLGGKTGRWVTADNGQRYFIADDGEVMGAPKAFKKDIGVAEAKDAVSWTIPPKNQGQMVEVGYAIDPYEGVVYMRVYDKSDRSAEYYKAPIDKIRGEYEPWNREPKVPDRAWKRMARPPAIEESIFEAIIPVSRLEGLLKDHDWMSQRGKDLREREDIFRVLRIVPIKLAKKLWLKYVPSSVSPPQLLRAGPGGFVD